MHTYIPYKANKYVLHILKKKQENQNDALQYFDTYKHIKIIPETNKHNTVNKQK